jgi:hypothetical protein
MSRTAVRLIALVGLFAIAPKLGAQTSTGNLTGRVTFEGAGQPGVTVSAASESLQGQRATTTSASGDYVLRGLPPGTYTVTFALQGFRTLEQEVKVSTAQSRGLDVTMMLESFTEEISVTARSETVGTSVESAETFEQGDMEKLAVDRSIESAVSLAAGTSNTGPGGLPVIAGAQSFESLYTMNGIVLNDNIRNQPMNMFIEDSIEETTVLTSGITAEYGRFSGGVVNMITKSGGNEFSGSLRLSFDNDEWTSATPLTGEQVDETNHTIEATLGGYLWRDRLWFFAAGRDRQLDASMQTHVSQIPYTQTSENRRLEGKLTALLSQSHRVTATYSDQQTPVTNQDFPPVPAMSLEAIDPKTDFDNVGLAFNYSGTFGDSFFVEAQYSQRQFTIADNGGDDPSLGGGTLIWDYILNGTFNAPWFCGEPCSDVQRDNENYFVKGSWFLSTEKLGTHDFSFGYDSFNDKVNRDNHQSASDYYLVTIGQNDFSSGAPMAVLLPFQFLISWSPIQEASQGTAFETNSFYVNDRWRLSDKVTLNLGVRWDENNGQDAGGAQVVDDSRLSPRLGVSWDLFGDSRWVVNASAARYVSAIVNHIANAGTAAGEPAFLQYIYGGPPILASELGSNHAAVEAALDWFLNVYGGPTNPALLYSAWLPGATPVIGDSLGSPYVDELSLGLTMRIGRSGLLRADYVHRDYGDFYADEIIAGRQVVDPIMGPLDLAVIRNEDELLDREYDALMTRFQTQIGDDLRLGGNWTWSHARGNWDGETAGGGALRSEVTTYQEYTDLDWLSPRGDLAVDQRHKVRAYAIWDAVATTRHHLSLSLLQSYLSGTPYSAVGTIDARPTIAAVGNPGYVTPPQFLPYYFSGRGAYRTDTITSTDIALNYAFSVKAFGADLEIFIQPEVLNVLNEDGVIGVNTAVLTSVNDASLQPFNALEDEPVEGVHWRRSAEFGTPQNEVSFQQPRTFRVSVGIRF